MSYLAGLSGFGGDRDREPALVCDGCGAMRPVASTSGMPFAWFLDRKRAPGWKFDANDGMRRDWCPDCIKKGTP